jgi:hypothetical protein
MIDFVQDITTYGELNDGSSHELITIPNAAETNLDSIDRNSSVEIHLQNLLNLDTLSTK